jgi:class 3 adenylate cyclase
LPDDPALAQVAIALNEARTWGQVFDPGWRFAYATDDVRLSQGSLLGLAPVPLGLHCFGQEAFESGLFGTIFNLESGRDALLGLGPWLLADTPGGRDELRELVHPAYRDLIDVIEPDDRSIARAYSVLAWYTAGGAPVRLRLMAWRVRDADGRLAGIAIQSAPEAGMAVVGTMAMAGDVGHLARMQSVAKAGRRPAAILFADLEASTPLARRLSTASYFALGRRLVRAADQCVVDAGGVVGRHVGDGVVAFFLAESAGSESTAARACVTAARALRAAIADVAVRSDRELEDIVMRFGLHWGSTLYVGQIATSGRFEVTALGDEVNEAARIEACASGGTGGAPGARGRSRARPRPGPCHVYNARRPCVRDREGPPRRTGHRRLRDLRAAEKPLNGAAFQIPMDARGTRPNRQARVEALRAALRDAGS